jgi:hypothetical protein
MAATGLGSASSALISAAVAVCTKPGGGTGTVVNAGGKAFRMLKIVASVVVVVVVVVVLVVVVVIGGGGEPVNYSV